MVLFPKNGHIHVHVCTCIIIHVCTVLVRYVHTLVYIIADRLQYRSDKEQSGIIPIHFCALPET